MDTIKFYLHDIFNESDSAFQLPELQKILSGTGIEVDIIEENGYKKLVFSYRYGDVKMKQTRRAGRKRDYVANPEEKTIGEIKSMISEIGTDLTAKELQMSRSTFFRVWKEKKTLPDDWIF